MINMHQIDTLVGNVPAGLWVGLAVVNLLLTIGTWSTARRRMRRAGERTADPRMVTGAARTRDTALTVAAMIPAALFWAMVLAGSFHSLIAFGRQILGWHNGWEYLVPGTLDGVSVTFAFLAFRAIRKQRSPDRCNRVVWGAAFASATVNFAYEYSHSAHNVVAGGYLALLSLFGMVMFHEFLDQFEDGTGYVKRENPKFGMRWLTWPGNTFCAAVAWRNHPPVEGTPATVREAVANLDRVRAAKHDARETAILDRHQRALAKARRRAELAAANASIAQHPEVEAAVIVPESVAASEAELPAAQLGIARPDTESIANEAGREAPTGAGADVRVPTTAATVGQWVATWLSMCADGDLVLGPLNDDDQARSRYNLSAKQLRNIRNAAVSGALRRRAVQLGVPLPAGYIDRPTATQVDDYHLEMQAA